MPKRSETSLYGPVKAFLELQGFEVKGEVQGCDLVAVRGPDVAGNALAGTSEAAGCSDTETELVVVELKLAMSLALVLQGIDRLKLTDLVYLAIPGPKRSQLRRWPETVQLCRRLGLGLLVVHLRARGGPRVEVVADPEPYKPRQIKRRRERLLGEFARRAGDHNVGGSRGGIVTAYRQDALRLAAALHACGSMRVVALRKATACERAGAILRANYYGWFAREDRGVYGLTPAGEGALVTFAAVVRGVDTTPDA